MNLNTRHDLFLIWHFVHTYLHSYLENYRPCMDVQHVEWVLYDWRSLFSVLELDVRYRWQVMAPNMHRSGFSISNLCMVTCITWKLQVICGRPAYRMTALLLETFLVHFRVAWEIRLEIYVPRNACHFSIQHYMWAYTASPYIHVHRCLVHNYAWQQNLHTLWLNTAQ